MAKVAMKGLGYSVRVPIANVKTLVAGRLSSDLTKTVGVVDTTNADGNGWSDGIPGTKGWSIELSAITLIDSATGDLDASQAALESAFEAGTPVQVTFRRPGQTLGRVGLAIITQLKETGMHDARSEFSASFQGVGALVPETGP